MRQGKKDRIKLNEKQQMGNLKSAIKASGPGALPATLKLAARLPEHGKGMPNKRKDLEADVRHLHPLLHTTVGYILPNFVSMTGLTACSLRPSNHNVFGAQASC